METPAGHVASCRLSLFVMFWASFYCTFTLLFFLLITRLPRLVAGGGMVCRARGVVWLCIVAAQGTPARAERAGSMCIPWFVPPSSLRSVHFSAAQVGPPFSSMHA